MDADRNATRAGPPREGPARSDQPDANQTKPLSPSKLARDVSAIRAAADYAAFAVAYEANRIEAGRRDAECRCPGRAYVAHAWDLAVHKDECPAGYAWVSVDDARAVLRRLPRRKLAALSVVLGGAA